jgi:hypothetical protein
MDFPIRPVLGAQAMTGQQNASPSVPRHPRWYRLTPDRFLLALLAVEGLLWLSERFQWFAFNSHKGWTVLIAVAAIGVALLLLLLWFLVSLLFRLPFQFGIRSLLVLTIVVALPCSWLAIGLRQASNQQAAREAFAARGGSAPYDYELDASRNWHRIQPAQSPAPAWLHKVVGDDFFADVAVVNLADTSVTDAGLEHLKGLRQLRMLILGSTQVTDAGLEHLDGLNRLQVLYLMNTQVTDAGLKHLNGLSQLQEFVLSNTRVTDAGLEHLEGLSQLRQLVLGCPRVTDAGLEHLEGLSRLQVLYLGDTQVTDAGLEHLRGLSQLDVLDLSGRRVTDAGLEHLKGVGQLRELHLAGTGVTDAGLEHLKGMRQLKVLDLDDTQVTGEGVLRLRKALPRCSIRTSPTE